MDQELTEKEKDLRYIAEGEIVVSNWEKNGSNSTLGITPKKVADSVAGTHSTPMDVALMIGQVLKNEVPGAEPTVEEKPDGTAAVSVLTADQQSAAQKLWSRTGLM